MSAKQFLRIGGIILVAVGILGFFLIGPTAERSIFGESWWFDNGENWAHLVIGIVAVILGFGTRNESVMKVATILAGVLALIAGIAGFFSQNFLGANLENPADNILHLAIGAWALAAGFRKSRMMSSRAMPPPIIR